MGSSSRRKATGAASVLGLFLGGFFLLTPVSEAAPSEKVTICHRTNSVTKPYTVNSVPVSSIDGSKKNDHSHHLGPIFDFSDPGQYTPPFSDDEWGDIIPPHEANGGVGQNWTEVAYDGGPTGQEIHAAGCVEPEDEPNEEEDPTATLTVRKVVTGDPAPETWDFEFALSNDEVDLGTIDLDEEGDEASLLDLDLGDYTITETLVDEFTLVDIDCGEETTVVEEENGVTVTLADGDDVTCIFTNDHEAPVEPEVEGPVEPDGAVENQRKTTEVLNEGTVRVPAAPAPVVAAEVTFTG